VHKMVETLQKPELQLVEEKIEDAEELTQSDLVLGVGSGVGLCVTVLLVVGLWVRHAKCGQRTEQTSLLQEYGTGQVNSVDDHGCRQSDSHRKSILKKQQNCDSSPDLIPQSDQESWNFCAATPSKDLITKDDLEDSCDFIHDASTMSASLISIKSSSRDVLLQHSTCDMDEAVNVFPTKISTSTLKRAGSTGNKRTFLLKEKRESIV